MRTKIFTLAMHAVSVICWLASLYECVDFWRDPAHDPIGIVVALQFITLALVADICLRVNQSA